MLLSPNIVPAYILERRDTQSSDCTQPIIRRERFLFFSSTLLLRPRCSRRSLRPISTALDHRSQFKDPVWPHFIRSYHSPAIRSGQRQPAKSPWPIQPMLPELKLPLSYSPAHWTSPPSLLTSTIPGTNIVCKNCPSDLSVIPTTSSSSDFDSQFNEANQQFNQTRNFVQAWMIIVPVVIGIVILSIVICLCVAYNRRKKRAPLTPYNASYGAQNQTTGPIHGGSVGKADGVEAGIPAQTQLSAQATSIVEAPSPLDARPPAEGDTGRQQYQYGARPGYVYDVSPIGAAELNGGFHGHHVSDHSAGASGGHGLADHSGVYSR